MSLKNTFIHCRLSSLENCKIKNRPSVAVLQLHLLCLFGASIVMSTWCWTPSSLETWKRYVRRKCGQQVIEEIKMPKHKVIAQTWAKRKEFEDKGRLSITLYNTHTDPVGLNFDVNDLHSSETNEISSTWANYLPQFVKRRMALTGAGNTNSSSQGPRKNSLDSEISFSVRHVSVESRRNSVDSQVSVKIAEMKTKVASRSRNRHNNHSQNYHQHSPKVQQSCHSKHATVHNKRSQKQRDIFASDAGTGCKYYNRRESSTSLESQVISVKKRTYPNAYHKVGLFSHSTKNQNSSSYGKSLKRRSGNTGINANEISEFLAKNGKIFLPFLQQQDMATSSDEETSRASFKVQGSRVDVVLKQDLNKDVDIDIGYEQNTPNGLKIEEIHDSYDRNSKQQVALENLLKSMQKSNESTNINSRSSIRCRQSSTRKAQVAAAAAVTAARVYNCNRRSQRRINKHKSTHSYPHQQQYSPINAHNHINDKNLMTISNLNLHFAHELNHCDSDSLPSCSSTEIDIPLGVMLHSSYSGMSTEKPNSRNSKTSCDVGIQANAYEIATQTLAPYEDNHNDFELAICQFNTINHQKSGLEICDNATAVTGHGEADNDDDTAVVSEKDALLNNCNNNGFREAIIMNESEKLKMLLLPSK